MMHHKGILSTKRTTQLKRPAPTHTTTTIKLPRKTPKQSCQIRSTPARSNDTKTAKSSRDPNIEIVSNLRNVNFSAADVTIWVCVRSGLSAKSLFAVAGSLVWAWEGLGDALCASWGAAEVVPMGRGRTAALFRFEVCLTDGWYQMIGSKEERHDLVNSRKRE